jgi:hypothetical protein
LWFGKTIEEAFVLCFKEAVKKIPSVIYLPHMDSWWNTASETLRTAFINMIQDVEPTLPLFFLATSDLPATDLPKELVSLFVGNLFELDFPDKLSRKEFFSSFSEDVARVELPPTVKKTTKKSVPKLAKAPSAVPLIPQSSTPEEAAAKKDAQEKKLKVLRRILRNILKRVHKEKKFHIFFREVNPEEYPGYYEVVSNALDLSIVLTRINDCVYTDIQSFLDDISVVVNNAIDFHPLNETVRVSNTVNNFFSFFNPFLTIAVEIGQVIARDCAVDGSPNRPSTHRVLCDNHERTRRSSTTPSSGRQAQTDCTQR